MKKTEESKFVKELRELFPDIADGILGHCIWYDYKEEDGTKKYDQALPLGFLVSWLRIVEKQSAEYYSKRYEFDENRAFSKFINMLTTVLVDKTDGGLIQAIVEDITEEYKKIHSK